MVEEHSFTDSAAAIQPSAERFDEAMEDLTWRLAIDAEAYPLLVANRGLRMAPTERAGDTPPLRVYFSCDDEIVRLLYVESAEDVEGAEPQGEL